MCFPLDGWGEDGGVRTVGCALSRLVPDAAYLAAIRGSVLSVHNATILATELLDMHLRRCLNGEADTDLASFFDGSVGCSFERLIPDERHKVAIRDAVTILPCFAWDGRKHLVCELVLIVTSFIAGASSSLCNTRCVPLFVRERRCVIYSHCRDSSVSFVIIV